MDVVTRILQNNSEHKLMVKVKEPFVEVYPTFDVEKIYFMYIYANIDYPTRRIDILMSDYKQFQLYYKPDGTDFHSHFEIVYPCNTLELKTDGGGNLAENVFANALPRGVCIEDVVNICF